MAEEKEPCRPDCQICEYHNRMVKAEKSRDFDYLMKFTKDVLDAWTQAEFEHDCDHVVLDGSWDTATQQLLWGLIKANGCEDHIKWKLEQDDKAKAKTKSDSDDMQEMRQKT